jgi:hypothetical protein
MPDNIADLMLVGNVSAGLLQCIFVPDITLARIECAACARASGVGALATHKENGSVVLKCAECDETLLKVIDTPHGLWLEMAGARCLKFSPTTNARR